MKCLDCDKHICDDCGICGCFHLSKWINVKIRLPESKQPIVFYVKDRENFYAGFFNLERQRFEENLDGWWFLDEEVTHWIPLPVLPHE